MFGSVMPHADQPREYRLVVRVKSSFYQTKKGYAYTRNINVLKRQSFGFNPMDENFMAVGEESLYDYINILDVEDGVYEVVVAREYRDWESGIVDEVDWQLIPVQE